MKVIFLLTVLSIILFSLHNPVLAVLLEDSEASLSASTSASIRPSSEIGYSRIHPASPLYFLKAVRENLELKLAGTERIKRLRVLEFAIRRLRETRTLITSNQDLIQPTLERYIAHLSNLTDKPLKNDEFGVIVKNNLVVHLKVLQQVYDQSSSLKANMAIRSAMNRIIQRADVPAFAKLSVCNFFNQEASSSILNQTEKFVLKERAQKCFDSLKSV